MYFLYGIWPTRGRSRRGAADSERPFLVEAGIAATLIEGEAGTTIRSRGVLLSRIAESADRRVRFSRDRSSLVCEYVDPREAPRRLQSDDGRRAEGVAESGPTAWSDTITIAPAACT